MSATVFVIPGAPVPKGRPRFSVRGKRVLTHTPDKTRAAEAAIAAHVAADAGRFPAGPVCVEALFVCTRPKRLMRRADPEDMVPAPVRPDLDNYVKTLLDGLAGLWGDDGQVCEVRAAKVFAAKGDGPCTVVRVSSSAGSAWMGGFYGAASGASTAELLAAMGGPS